MRRPAPWGRLLLGAAIGAAAIGSVFLVELVRAALLASAVVFGLAHAPNDAPGGCRSPVQCSAA